MQVCCLLLRCASDSRDDDTMIYCNLVCANLTTDNVLLNILRFLCGFWQNLS